MLRSSSSSSSATEVKTPSSSSSTNNNKKSAVSVPVVDLAQVDLQPTEVDMVIYHHPCSDGFASAWVVRYFFESQGLVEQQMPEFVPAVHGTPAPAPPNVDGRNVLICDFSYPAAVMLDMIRRAHKLLILDHHKTAEAALASLPFRNKIFRQDLSGVGLTWQYCFPGRATQLPPFLAHIQDNDLWRHALPDTRAVATMLYGMPFEFDVYGQYVVGKNEMLQGKASSSSGGDVKRQYQYQIQNQDRPAELDKLIDHGRVVLQSNQRLIDDIVRHAGCFFTRIRERYYLVACVNSNVFKSEIGNQLITKRFPLADFAAVYHHDSVSHTTQFSLRSTDRHSDVGELASSAFGGGGHRNASGFSTPDLVGMLPVLYYKDFNVYDVVDQGNEALLTMTTSGHGQQQLLVFRILYLKSTKHKTKLGLYMVQHPRVVENQMDLVAVRSYDATMDRTWFSLVFRDTVAPGVRRALLSRLQNLNNKSSTSKNNTTPQQCWLLWQPGDCQSLTLSTLVSS